MQPPLEPEQYLSIRYTERLADVGIEPSVGSVGDSYDNALAETIIGLYKTELIRMRGSWKGLDDVEYSTLEWVDWFNHRRLLEPIGNIPPAEKEDNYYRQKSPADTVALKTTSGVPWVGRRQLSGFMLPMLLRVELRTRRVSSC